MSLKVFLRLLPYILGSLLLFYLGSKLYQHVYEKGANSVQVQWDAAKTQHEEDIRKLKEEYALREESHRAENRRISSELAQAKLDHAAAVADIRREYDRRVQLSEQRAATYQRLAEGGAAERGSLASHASRLDATLEEGRQLVRELRETLGLRERQLRAVSHQLQNDRALIEGTTP